MFDITGEINKLCVKYGDDFNWGAVIGKNGFVRELQKETDISQYCEVKAVARSYSNDDVLFLLDNKIYRVYHLTYSKQHTVGFPKYTEFLDGEAAVAYIEKQFVEEYL